MSRDSVPSDMDHSQGSWRVRGPFREGGLCALGWVEGREGREGLFSDVI